MLSNYFVKKPRALMQHWPIFVMIMAVLAVMLPLFGRGFIMNYDMVFSPYIDINLSTASDGYSLYQPYFLISLLKILSFILPIEIVHKLILAAILFLSTYLIYKTIAVKSQTARLLAGLIYTFNPFVYDRFMAGHWRFMLAYAITPLVVKAFYELFTQPNRSNIIKTILWWTLATFISVHHLVILSVLFGCLGLFFIRNKKSLLATLACIGGVLVANCWWIVPALLTKNITQNFGLDQFYAFATKTDAMHGIWFNMLSLHGFWYSGWRNLKDYYSFWPALILIWLLPAMLSLSLANILNRNTKKLLLALGLAGLLAIIFAAGPYPPNYEINNWIFLHIPGMAGLREPQKLLALLTIFYSYLIAHGLDWLLKKRLTLPVFAILSICVFSILLVARPFLWGFSRQLKPYSYPQEWYALRFILDNQARPSKVLLLPWDIYATNTITSSLTANPARSFFGKYVVASHRMSLANIKDIETKQHQAVTLALQQKNATALAKASKNCQANYIVITEGFGKNEYSWLLNSDNVRVFIKTQHLWVLKIDL